MLIDIFRGSGTFGQKITMLFLIVLTTLISLTVHEVSHGYAAYRCGDPTARNFGRLSLNPLKHLDPIGTLCMLLFGFGWAKPVPINTRYFRKPRRDTALTALAGPLSNIIISFIACFFMMLSEQLYYRVYFSGNSYALTVVYLLFQLFYLFHRLNLTLAVFNLIPVPPLDGSRIFLTFLPPKYYFGVMKYERYISLAIMLLLFSGVLSGFLGWICNIVSNAFQWVWGLLPFLG